MKGKVHLINKQECIPVGCVPAAHRPYAGVCFPGGGRPSRGGSPSRGVSIWGGGSPSGGGFLHLGGYGIPACTEADTPHPAVDRQTPVKILPWPQLRCGR